MPPTDILSVFTHSVTECFLKGLVKTYPPVNKPTLTWNLNLVFSALTKTLFEPMASCCLICLFMKVAFLVAITSGRRVGEVGAFMMDPPYTIFHNDKIYPRLRSKFTPKVILDFLPNQTIHLPTFFLKVKTEGFMPWISLKPMVFYFQRTKLFRKSPKLFISFAEWMRGEVISSQRLFKWIVGCMMLCYKLMNVTLPQGVIDQSRSA